MLQKCQNQLSVNQMSILFCEIIVDGCNHSLNVWDFDRLFILPPDRSCEDSPILDLAFETALCPLGYGIMVYYNTQKRSESLNTNISTSENPLQIHYFCNGFCNGFVMDFVMDFLHYVKKRSGPRTERKKYRYRIQQQWNSHAEVSCIGNKRHGK